MAKWTPEGISERHIQDSLHPASVLLQKVDVRRRNVPGEGQQTGRFPWPPLLRHPVFFFDSDLLPSLRCVSLR